MDVGSLMRLERSIVSTLFARASSRCFNTACVDPFAADGIYIASSPERIFAALVDPAEVLAWMGTVEAALEARAGGSYRVLRTDGALTQGVVGECREGACLWVRDYFWERGSERRGPMSLRFTLTAQGAGVWLLVRQDGLDANRDWKRFALEVQKELVAITVNVKRHVEGI